MKMTIHCHCYGSGCEEDCDTGMVRKEIYELAYQEVILKEFQKCSIVI